MNLRTGRVTREVAGAARMQRDRVEATAIEAVIGHEN